jgi:glycogen synthase
LTREYIPEVYGGAGVHLGYLARELARFTRLEVHCFGEERPAEEDRRVIAHRPMPELVGEGPHLVALQAMSVDITMAASLSEMDVVHSHTWYTNFAGHLAKLLYDIPHVATVHSLEPLRPWKADQLGSGYQVSRFCARVGLESADAVIAVSAAMADDLRRCYPAIDPDRVTVIPNGVDPEEFKPDRHKDVLERYRLDPALPTVVCVARITRQKGLVHLLDAARFLTRELRIRTARSALLSEAQRSTNVRQDHGKGIHGECDPTNRNGAQQVHALVAGQGEEPGRHGTKVARRPALTGRADRPIFSLLNLRREAPRHIDTVRWGPADDRVQDSCLFRRRSVTELSGIL